MDLIDEHWEQNWFGLIKRSWWCGVELGADETRRDELELGGSELTRLHKWQLNLLHWFWFRVTRVHVFSCLAFRLEDWDWDEGNGVRFSRPGAIFDYYYPEC